MSTASFFPPSANLVRSPVQAANVFSQVGNLPRQRNVFIVRFVSPVIPQLESVSTSTGALTYVVKTIERPKINPKTEELNQYNKKRQVYTGYKLEPIRMQFYDDASGSAQSLWKRYANWYFGDLANLSGTTGQNGVGNQAYSYDVTTGTFNDPGTGFGFTARNGGSASNPNTDINGQFFFDRIEVYHFYETMYDLYYLVHPKFSSFEPDDLDYESSAVALINTTVVYENLQYFPQQKVGNSEFSEFDDKFNGNPLVIADTKFPNANATANMGGFAQANPTIGSLLAPPTGAFGPVADYRYTGVPSSGPLGLFGNFSFGPSGAGFNVGVNLSSMSLGNPALAAALSVGATGDPLGASSPILYNSAAASNRGLNGALYDVLNATVQGASSGFGTATSMLTSGMLASNALSGVGVATNPDGQIVLDPQAYGAINAQQTGTAQYGYNVNTNASGFSWGTAGPNGFVGPNDGPQNSGPYTTNEVAGIDARFVAEPPVDSGDF